MGDTIQDLIIPCTRLLCIVPANILRQAFDCGSTTRYVYRKPHPCLLKTLPIFTENPALTNYVVTMQPADMTDMILCWKDMY